MKGLTEYIKESSYTAQYTEDFDDIIDDELDGELNEDDESIKSEDEFVEYVKKLCQKAHPDDYDEKTAEKMAHDIAKKCDSDWGKAVGMAQSGMGA